MSIHPQKSGGKGSLNQIQLWVNNRAQLLNQEIEKAIPSLVGDSITWVSPLKTNSFSEYRDGDFLDVLGLSAHKSSLKSFWPNGGPQWDGLAKTKSGKVILVEAKANVLELKSSCQAKAESSILSISHSLEAAKSYFRVSAAADWKNGYYQYANRLAQLYFLKDVCKVDAHLLFVHFLDDKSVYGPLTQLEWNLALHPMYAHLGIAKNWPQVLVANVFIPAI